MYLNEYIKTPVFKIYMKTYQYSLLIDLHIYFKHRFFYIFIYIHRLKDDR